MIKFVHLKIHSEYSVTDGIVKIDDLCTKLRELKMPAVALTDQSNLFATIKFYRAALAAGIKPIIAAEVWVQGVENKYRLSLYCQNQQGYRNLIYLISRSYTEETRRGEPVVLLDWLTAETCQGLLALSGGMYGELGLLLQKNKIAEAQTQLAFWKQLFPDRYYLEIQRLGRPQEEEILQQTVNLALATDTPIVATNDVRFLNQDDFYAHEARVCINQGWMLDDPARPREYQMSQYLRSATEMEELFGDLPVALTNSVEIAKRCNLEIKLNKNFLPEFHLDGEITENEYLAQVAQEGLTARLQLIFQDRLAELENLSQPYLQRLETELKVIQSMGFAGYFLIVADFIQWAKNNQIPVGPGRGSGAGSLVAYALKITDLDPLQYDLLFERFLNPERISLPDFDIDFCMIGRDRVIEYVMQKYGRTSVSQIITFGTMAAKAVVRDVGRVLGHPYGLVDKLAKLIPFELGMTLSKALEQEPALKKMLDEEEEIQNLFRLALKLEGVIRNVGKHAGGVVIAPRQLIDFVPLYCEAGGENLVTQFDKDDVEAVGLVKFDFLGLRTLTIIDKTLQLINAQRQAQQEPSLDLNVIPLDDPATFNLLQECKTVAVFQLESSGMRDLVKRLQPDCLEDIIAIVALFRPGPLQSGMVDDFINRKHGRAPVRYLHPKLEPILKSTYGVILYQEQVMQIAQSLAGYTLGGADLLRRAMGKKKPEEMAEQRTIFLRGAQEHRINAETANEIFDLMEKFAGYGFNKSHSATYGLLTYQTAWLKAHYLPEFMSAVLSSDMDNTDKVVLFINDCRMLKLKILPPCINTSTYNFGVNPQGEITYGLGAIKGVGKSAIDSIVEARERQGDFTDLLDFCSKIDLRKVNKRVLEALIKSGAMDTFNPHRASLLASLPKAVSLAEQMQRNQALGTLDLFADLETESSSQAPAFEYLECGEWTLGQSLSFEKEVLGWCMSGDPLQEYREALDKLGAKVIGELAISNTKTLVAGIIIALRAVKTRQNKMLQIVTIEDGSGKIDFALFAEEIERYRGMLIKDQAIVVEGLVQHDNFTGGLRLKVQKIFNLQQKIMQGNPSSPAKTLVLDLNAADFSARPQILEQVYDLLAQHRNGDSPVYLRYSNREASGLICARTWRISLSPALLESLKKLLGATKVEVKESA